MGSLDGGQLNVYDAIYGGPTLSMAKTPASVETWFEDHWELSAFGLGDFGNGASTAHSVLSLSEESLSSAEDLAPSEMGLSMSSLDYRNSLLPVTTACTTSDSFILDGLDKFGI